MIEITDAGLDGVKIIAPAKHGDHRGFFSETYRESLFAAAGLPTRFVQDNHSFSAARHVLRGLHFQAGPQPQGKLVRIIRGAVLDVVVDIRRGSPSYGRHIAVELSAENWRQIWVPPGFAHGFLTLTENTEALYKVTAEYAPEWEGGVRFDDPALGINWGIAPDQATTSPRDRQWPDWDRFQSPFAVNS
jgi:dTDP-4-dehydrorhamnose 3,5-epimerase